MAEAMRDCAIGEEDPKCKEAMERAKSFDAEVKEECRKDGMLCLVTSEDKEGKEEEEQCIPTECHGEVDLIEEEKVPECKDFKCEIEIKCAGHKEREFTMDEIEEEEKEEEEDWEKHPDAEKDEEKEELKLEEEEMKEEEKEEEEKEEEEEEKEE